MRTELLAPAGDLERLKVAIVYGADAVYFGGKQFSLRARASNFTLENIKEACEFAHSYGKRVYVTVNIIPHTGDFEGLEDYLKTLESYGVDAIICASQSIMKTGKRVAPGMEYHISTQQTTLSSAGIKYWQKLGADRVVLGREVTLQQLKEIKPKTDMPLEVFIHGGMCANYSGRCTISNHLTNRDANRGGCAQSCRWFYHLWQDEQLLDRDDGLLSMGSKDMCALDNLENLLKLQVSSLKIEGRMKTAYYIASIVKGYRYAMDCYYEKGHITEEELKKAAGLLQLAENRETFPGFYNGQFGREGQLYTSDNTVTQTFLANVLEYDEQTGEAVLEVRNHFEKGDRAVVMNPQGDEVPFVLEKMLDEEGNEVEIANKPMQRLRVKVPVKVNSYTFIHSERK